MPRIFGCKIVRFSWKLFQRSANHPLGLPAVIGIGGIVVIYTMLLCVPNHCVDSFFINRSISIRARQRQAHGAESQHGQFFVLKVFSSSDIAPLIYLYLADKVCHNSRKLLRQSNIALMLAFDQIRHVVSQSFHYAYPFFIGVDILRRIPMNPIPIAGGYNRHLRNCKILERDRYQICQEHSFFPCGCSDSLHCHLAQNLLTTLYSIALFSGRTPSYTNIQ